MADFVPSIRVVFTGELAPNIVLTDVAACQHLVQVKRVKPCQKITLVHTPTETAYQATIIDCSPKQVQLQLGEVLPSIESTLPNITLAMALIKGQRWDWCLQKATELGVRTIQPLLTEYTVVDWKNSAHKLARWQEITKNAVQQCDGRFLPAIYEPLSLADWLPNVNESHPRLVLMERGPHRQSFREALPPQPPKQLTIVVGPEGGLSDGEADQLIDAGFTNVLLGQRILRAETAAIAAVSGVVALYC